MATNIGNLDIGLVVGFFGRLWAFFQGFRAYSKSRLLQDTPETPIRSIAMGFVRIHGKAKSDQLVKSPVTHTPCCYYIVQIHKWQEFKDGRAYSSDEERGGERKHISAAVSRSRMIIGPPHWGQDQVEVEG